MELVLSPGRLGGGDRNAPFQNQEIREWSHVDRLTGMLEHARVETGRWQARHQGSAQAYGKVVDSRERNSADGNVVQKACRQVEVFQSQGVGGRSVQVVRASQWSSSRITDSTSSSPVSVSMNEGHQRNGSDETADSKSTRLSSDESSLTKLSQVSRLCRQIHADAIHRHTTNSPVKKTTASFVKRNFEDDANSSSFMHGVKSTSNEDLATSATDTIKSPFQFRRDCRERRSLQTPKSAGTKTQPERTLNKINAVLSEVDDRIKSENARYNVMELEYQPGLSYNDIDSIGEHYESINDRNDNRKTSSSYLLGQEELVSESTDSSNIFANGNNGEFAEHPNFPSRTKLDDGTTRSKCESYHDCLRPVPISINANSGQQTSFVKPNTTVVHLNNVLLPGKSDTLQSKENDHGSENVGSIHVASSVQCRIHSVSNDFSRTKYQPKTSLEFLRYNQTNSPTTELPTQSLQGPVFQQRKQSSTDGNERIEAKIPVVMNGDSQNNDVMVASERNISLENDETNFSFGKPLKKVGFSKTEIHFAAESGKVNIVETDCKPPPSNRFRRRRKNTTLQMSKNNKNLPLIHFGDTSYEKYIFGQTNLVQPEKLSSHKDKNITCPSDETSLTDNKCTLDNLNDGWGIKLKTILQTEPPTSNDDETNLDTIYDDTENAIVDHAFRGHTTTVNLGVNLPLKIKHINEGKCDTISTGIQPWFDNRPRTMLHVATFDNVALCGAKTTSRNLEPLKSLAVAPSMISKIPRPLTHVQHSVLKSTHLIMNLNRVKDLSTVIKSADNPDDPSITLKNLLSSLPGCTEMMIPRRNESSSSSSSTVEVNNNYSKNTSTLIAINTGAMSGAENDHSRTGNDVTARFVPLASTNVDRAHRNQASKIRDTIETQDGQLQYSSGSEQADEEVRSYMLGSRISRDKVKQRISEKETRIWTSGEHAIRTTSKDTKNNESCLSRVVDRDEEGLKTGWKWKYVKNDRTENVINRSLINDDSDLINSELSVDEECVEVNKFVDKNRLLDIIDERNVVTSDNENNKVLLNIVKTHKSIVARVEDCPMPENGKTMVPANKIATRSRPRTHRSSEPAAVQESYDSMKSLPCSLSVKQSNVNKETSGQPFNIKAEASMKQTNVKQTNVKQSNVKQTNVKQTNVKQMNAKQTNANETSVKDTNVKQTNVKHKAKELCDNVITRTKVKSSSDVEKNEITDPTYVNVFVKSDNEEVPIYENYRINRNIGNENKKYAKLSQSGNVSLAELNAVTKNTLESTMNGRCGTESSLPSTDCDEDDPNEISSKSRNKKLDTITENTSIRQSNRENRKVKQLSKTRSKKILTTASSASSIESIYQTPIYDTAKKIETKIPKDRSSRTTKNYKMSNNRSETSRKIRDDSNSHDEKTGTIERQTRMKTTRLNRGPNSTSSEHATRKTNESIRSKKPVEFVHQTAVFNMKNEKLSRSSKTAKESKTPRYINDLICGSKYKRSSDIKQVRGTASSQQRAHNKGASPTNRHWK